MGSSGSKYDNEYIPLANRKLRRRWTPSWITAGALVCVSVLLNVALYKRLYVPPGPLQSYQDINPFSTVAPVNTTIPEPHQRAVVSTLYSESYVPGIVTLGHSLTEAQTQARRILLYFPDHISAASQCQLRSVGWELHPISRISPPDDGRGVYYRFLDQYSKLQIWTLDTLGITAALYLDGDTLVRRNIDELWAVAAATGFAAVPDVYSDNRGFALSFNAGVMLLRTSSAVFEDMCAKIGTARYRHAEAEQGFLNAYFSASLTRLPYIYNGNLALKKKSPEMWNALMRDVGIVHYTLTKPFPAEDNEVDDERIRKQLAKSLKFNDGLFADEMRWWEGAWTRAKASVSGSC